MNTLDRDIAPLRPDRDHARQQSMRSLARSCLDVCRRDLGKELHKVPLVTRTAQTPTSTTDAAALMTITMHLVESLQPVSAAANVIARSLGLSFGQAEQLSIPTVAMPGADFVAEGQPIPVVQGQTSPGPQLDPHKVGVLVVLTGEMIRNTRGEAIIRQALIEATAARFDALMFSTAPGVPNQRPPGVLNGIAPLAPSAAGNPLDAMIADLQEIAKAAAPVSGSGTPILIAAPAQAVSLAMLAPRDVWPVFASASLPDKTVVGLVPEAVATVVEPPRIEAGNQMVVHRETQPGEIVDIGGVSASPVGSVYQTDSVGLRLVQPVTWGLRSPSAVAWIENVAW
jgi:hypothetical protein